MTIQLSASHGIIIPETLRQHQAWGSKIGTVKTQVQEENKFFLLLTLKTSPLIHSYCIKVIGKQINNRNLCFFTTIFKNPFR